MPAISGVHHVTFVVGDLDAGVSWFTQVLGARHIQRFDHHDALGALFGVILELSGFPGMIELRIADAGYPARPGYDPVTFEVPDDAALEAWAGHLRTVGAACTPIKRRRTGRSIEVEGPDGIVVRLFTAPAGGFGAVPFQERHVDP
ncbi:VOC family protein [Amycolatopsis sp. H20-H5]|uniref:VOC family protein n=1 Tax=Amycolatopsis sp. H20-H5 TaxID=3046309 RepID=UPI002DBE3560|nr:VOC family protein [Amycolatopsis sp. H20-H5]MEC3974440.1 VOC family protein [Amycolatopsis sp. H20-H5]